MPSLAFVSMTTSWGPVPEAFLPVPSDSLHSPGKSGSSGVSLLVSESLDAELSEAVISEPEVGALVSLSSDPVGPTFEALEPDAELLVAAPEPPLLPVSWLVAVPPEGPVVVDVPLVPVAPCAVDDDVLLVVVCTPLLFVAVVVGALLDVWSVFVVSPPVELPAQLEVVLPMPTKRPNKASTRLCSLLIECSSDRR